MTSVSHDYAYFNYAVSGDTVVVEGTSTGETADGVEWRPDGTPGGGRWCDVFEVYDGVIQRLFIYPDYAGGGGTLPVVRRRHVDRRGGRWRRSLWRPDEYIRTLRRNVT